MMTRRCSHCSNNGHNSRTCPTRSAAPTGGGGGGGGGPSSLSGVKLFGVRLTDGSIIKKSASMGNLSAHYHSSSSAASPNPESPVSDHARDSGRLADGYLSDDPAHASSSSNRRGDRKKGVPWTEEEHRLFLIGLQKLGKGDWRGIARNYVVSRTPTQVASHAQKYFIRQSNASRRKRRSSLFDMVTDAASDPHSVPEEKEFLSLQAKESDNADKHPSLNLSLKPDYEPMETTSEEPAQEEKADETTMGSNESIPPNVPRPTQFTLLAPSSTNEFTPFVHQFVPAYVPVPYPFWPANPVPVEETMVTETSNHQVVRPVAAVPKQPVNVDELIGISNLSIGEHSPSPLSLKLTAEASRHSAFHANTPVSRPEIGKGKDNAIQAV